MKPTQKLFWDSLPWYGAGWGAAVQPASLSPEKTQVWSTTTIMPGLPTAWGRALLLCLRPAKARAQIRAGVQTAQT